MTVEHLTHIQRESVYAEGKRAFEAGQRRRHNPYAASSTSLEQIWWNGWDHSRRKKQREGSSFSMNFGGKMSEKITPAKKESVYAEGMRAFEEHTQRSFNPYAASNQELAMLWWHGWDTAEERSKDEVNQPRQDGKPA
jgi:hypothetical protein